MTGFSHLSTHLPKFSPYLNEKTAGDCLRKMIKEKKGKMFVSFYKKAAPLRFDSNGALKNDAQLKKLLDRAVELQEKLPQKAKHKFEKQVNKWEKVEKANKAAEEALIKNKAKDASLMSDEQKLTLQFQKIKLGTKSREVAFAMDWSKDDPVLFNPTYVKSLIKEGMEHPDMKNPHISKDNKAKFLELLNDLMTDGSDELSNKNNTRIKKMILAILNTLNDLKKTPKFQETYAAIVFNICGAFKHCSNRINSEIEAIFTNLCYPKDGNLGQRIRIALQLMRAQLFRKAIHLQVAHKPSYLEEEACSVNYYSRKMATSFGLPPTVSSLDNNYDSLALKGKEKNIHKFFEKEYTPFAIYKKLSESIQDSQDNSIPCKLFTDWVEAHYSLEERYKLLDDSGKYSPECFIRLFTELEIFEKSK